MRYTYIRREFPRNNPLANILVIIAGAVVITVSLIVGFLAFLVLGALVLVSAAVIGVRVWWLKRRIARQAERRPRPDRESAHGVIEGEYRVVDEERERP